MTTQTIEDTRLTEAINRRLMQGWQLVSRDETTAVLVRPGRKVNHILHLLLSLVTVGVWLVVWIPLTIFQRREKRMMITVDERGVHER